MSETLVWPRDDSEERARNLAQYFGEPITLAEWPDGSYCVMRGTLTDAHRRVLTEYRPGWQGFFATLHKKGQQ